MTCCQGLAKCFLILFNIIFIVIGLVLTAVGVLLRFFLDDFLSSSLTSSLPFDISSFSELPAPFDSLIQTLAETAGLILLLVGGVILFVALIGCCGAMTKKKCCLGMYIVLVSIILAVQIAAVVYFYVKRDDIDKSAKAELLNVIKTEYEGDNSTVPSSVAWTLVNKVYACCGITNYTDFWQAQRWSRQYNVSYTVSGVSGVYTVNLATPISCCKFEGGFLSTAFVSPNCSVAPDAVNSNYLTGCYDKLTGIIDGAPLLSVSIVCGAAFFVQLVLIICAACLCKEKEKEDVMKF